MISSCCIEDFRIHIIISGEFLALPDNTSYMVPLMGSIEIVITRNYFRLDIFFKSLHRNNQQKRRTSSSSCGNTALLYTTLFHEYHLVQQVICSGEFVYREQDVADVERDVAAIVRIEDDIAHSSFPDTVEIQTYQVAVLVYHRAA